MKYDHRRQTTTNTLELEKESHKCQLIVLFEVGYNKK